MASLARIALTLASRPSEISWIAFLPGSVVASFSACSASSSESDRLSSSSTAPSPIELGSVGVFSSVSSPDFS